MAASKPELSVRVAHAEEDRDACIRIRRDVFIDEQSVPEADEIDGCDDTCEHFLALWDDEPVGCARLMVTPEGQAKAQRVAVRRPFRGRGVGQALMKAVEWRAEDQGFGALVLGAQQSAISFYDAIGYAAYGDTFMDAGIPHRMMRRVLGPHTGAGAPSGTPPERTLEPPDKSD